MEGNSTLIAIEIPSLDHSTFALSFNQSKSHTTWIDWGDNDHNQREIYDEVGTISLTHTYSEPGQYDIELIVVDEGSIELLSIGDEEGYHNMITQIVIGDGVTSIGSYMFANCDNLEDLQFSEGCAPEIGAYAFANCGSLVEVEIPNGANLLDGAFFNCSGLKEVTLPESVSTIWPQTFSGCSQLKKVNAPEQSNIYEVGDYAFQGCRKLKNIDFCKTVSKVGNGAFDSCSSLSTIEFTAVQSVGNNAFCNCTFLTSVGFPDTIKEIGEYAFVNDGFLKEIKIAARKAPVLHGMHAFDGDEKFIIKVPRDCKSNYINETNWTVFADKMEEGL